eukprot:XP_014623224.1 uncharacterized protein LOC106796160 [Glycine max]
MAISFKDEDYPWFNNMANFKATGQPPEVTAQFIVRWNWKRNTERNRKFLQDIEAAAIQEERLSFEASSSFPKQGESHIVLFEANTMADEPRRVTLEDYSSSSVPQFFTSIARPEVQAQNITYPHSLIQLIQNNLFHGLPNEDLYAYLATYIEICNTVRLAGCVICGGEHDFGCCIPTEDAAHEVNYMGNHPRPNFNAGGYSGFQHGQQFNQQLGQWRTHPSNQFNKDQGRPSNRPQQQGPNLYDRTTKLEETLAQFMQVSMSNQKSTESAIKNLEVQVGQLAKQLADRPSSSFGANTEKNPKEECKVVMTRSKMVSMNEGNKRMGEEKQQLMTEPKIAPVVEPLSETEEEVEAKDDQQKEIPIIVPSRKDKERHPARFLDIFKKLEITMPFGEALQQMPLYAKFLKNMLTRKNKYIHSDTIVVEGNCSAIIQRILPPKHKDPGSALYLVLYVKFLLLADRSITRPYGVIEDVLVRVKHLIFPTDFMVMDMEEDIDIPLILGRPFMATASCVVNMGKKKLEMGIEDKKD